MSTSTVDFVSRPSPRKKAKFCDLVSTNANRSSTLCTLLTKHDDTSNRAPTSGAGDHRATNAHELFAWRTTLMDRHIIRSRKPVRFATDVSKTTNNVLELLERSNNPGSIREASRLWRKFKLYSEDLCSKMGSNDPTISLIFYIQTQLDEADVQPQTAIRYLSILRITAIRMGLTFDNILLNDYKNALLHECQTEADEKQALPLRRSQFERLLELLQPKEKLILKLMRKLAARFDDVQGLTPERIRIVDAETMYVNLDGITKQTKWSPNQRHRADHHLCLKWLREEIELFKTIRPDELAPWTEATFQRLLDRIQPPVQDLIEFPERRTKYTLHSLKVGAVADAATILVAKQLPPDEISTLIRRLARHKNALNPLPPISVRYMPDKSIVGMLNGTVELTKEM